MIEVEDLQVSYVAARGGWLTRGATTIVHGVGFTLDRGEVLGLVGESGSGKTTIARAIVRLLAPSGGRIRIDGQDVTALSRSALRPMRRHVQMIFQDPYSSLDARLTVQQVIAEAFAIHRIGSTKDWPDRVAALLGQVGLPADAMHRYPHEFSGGQRQRIGIARALAVEPRYIVADEPVSALDVSVQAQVINLLQDLQGRFGLGVLFIAHDRAVVQHVSDRVAVLYMGRVMELAPSRQLYAAPRHPYTMALLDAAPVPDPRQRPKRTPLRGEIPRPEAPPSGCVFRTRCPHAIGDCAMTAPPLTEVAPGHWKACIRDDVS
jgi:oligopeptide/dipeptide ABC transporter ATP-binding protein